MSAVVYVASRSPRAEQALKEGQVIEVCYGGPDPQGDAESYAKDETKWTEVETYVYCIEISKPLRGYRVYKEVNAFVPPQQG